MNVKEALVTYLKTKTLLTAIIGTGTNARIYPETAPQDIDISNGSYVVFQVTDTEHPEHMGGACAYAENTFLFSIYADTVARRHALKEALRNLLHTRRNLVLSTSEGSIEIRTIKLLSCADGYFDSPDGGETGAFAQDMTFLVVFFETLPTLV